MEQRTAGGTTHIAFMLMTAALIAESLLLNHALTQYSDRAAAETLLTLSKIVVSMTAVTELALLALWVIYMRLALSNQKMADEEAARVREQYAGESLNYRCSGKDR